VTDRERVVAELVPPGSGREAIATDALLADAVRKGWLTPPLGAADSTIPHRPATTLADLLAELDDDRSDR
jgi:hypothetical protein